LHSIPMLHIPKPLPLVYSSIFKHNFSSFLQLCVLVMNSCSLIIISYFYSLKSFEK
jgi:hypothetical protein